MILTTLNLARKFFITSIITLSICFFFLGCSTSEKSKPKITSLDPATGKVGDPVVIRGEFLGTTKSILFGTTQALIIDAQQGQVTTQVPAGVLVGQVNVMVKDETDISNALPFVVSIPPPPVPGPGPVTPEIPIDKKATINNTVPVISYPGYPIMLRGKNFKNTTKVLFNTKEATIITNYNETLTVFVPALPNGAYTIKVKTSENGTSDGVPFNITSAPSGFQTPPTTNFISPPPAEFTAVISNQWSLFLLSKGSEEQCQLVDLNDGDFCGSYKFETDPTTHKVINNYIEFTRDNVEHFYGQWSSPYSIPCVQKIVFISGKDGRYFSATVDVSDTENCE